MPSPRAAVFTLGPVTITTTTETAIGTVGPVNFNANLPSQGVLVEGTFNFTAGASTTAAVVRIRAGAGTGGAQLASHTFTVAAATSYPLTANWLDVTPVGVGVIPVTYTITVQQTGATGNGSVNNSSVAAEECVAVW